MNHFLITALLAITVLFNHTAQSQSLNVLIVTGGHDFERAPFFDMFDQFPDIKYKESIHPEADRLLGSKKIDAYDVIVFYDMPKKIDDATKDAFIKLSKEGKPMVFLHHSIASYPDWAEFVKILGGKYFEKATATHGPSSYRHDVDVPVSIVDKTHPITRGMKDFIIRDEVYGNILVLPQCVILLKTTHPDSSPEIGWTNQYNNARIVYLQSGHDHFAFENPNFRELLYRSIRWSAGKLK